MFVVVCGKDRNGFSYSEYENYLVLSYHSSLNDAGKARKTGQDLVFNEYGEIVKDQFWLWDWEKANPESYAHKCILANKSTKCSF